MPEQWCLINYIHLFNWRHRTPHIACNQSNRYLPIFLSPIWWCDYETSLGFLSPLFRIHLQMKCWWWQCWIRCQSKGSVQIEKMAATSILQLILTEHFLHYIRQSSNRFRVWLSSKCFTLQKLVLLNKRRLLHVQIPNSNNNNNKNST